MMLCVLHAGRRVALYTNWPHSVAVLVYVGYTIGRLLSIARQTTALHRQARKVATTMPEPRYTNKQAIAELIADYGGNIPLGAELTMADIDQGYTLIDYRWQSIKIGRRRVKQRLYVWKSECPVCDADFTYATKRTFASIKRTCPEHTGQFRAPRPEKPKPEKKLRYWPNATAIRATIEAHGLVCDAMPLSAFVIDAAGRLEDKPGMRDTRAFRIARALHRMIELELIPVRIDGDTITFLE